MSKIQHITGENYLTAEELLKKLLDESDCEAVMVAVLRPNNRITTHTSSGFSRMQAVYMAELIRFDVQHANFWDDEDE